MVLVLPEFRRRGFAQQLLRHALAHLQAQGRAAVLDATPAGHAVYVQEGFADTWGFARYRREAGGAARAGRAVPATRPLAEGRLADDRRTGRARPSVPAGCRCCARLAQRLPQAARVLEQGGRLCGYVLGRNGREAAQIGPLLRRRRPDVRMRLLHDALQPLAGPGGLRGPAGPPAARCCRGCSSWVSSSSAPSRAWCTAPMAAPGDPAAIVLAAGPELG